MSNKLSDLILRALDAGLVPFLEGSPGVGKTQASRAVAKSINYKHMDIRLSTMDPTDMSGIPTKVEVHRANGSIATRMEHVPTTLFPLEGDELPLKYDANGNSYLVDEVDDQGNVVLGKNKKPNQVPARYDGWLLCFEELTSCNPAMQAASFKILLEREVGEAKLHPAVEMVATGNRASDKAVVIPMSTPMRTRLCFIEVAVDNAEWVKWAHKEGFDTRIISYLQWRPEALNAFDPNIKQLNCPVPRTWEFANSLLQQDTSTVTYMLDSVTSQLIEGVIGATANEFKLFLSVFEHLPSIAAILKDPANAELPLEASHQYALTSVISNEMAKPNSDMKALTEYVNRMDPELQTVAYMETFRKNRSMMSNIHVNKWVILNQDMITAEI